MTDLIAFDLSKGTDQEQRLYGMKALGKIYNDRFKAGMSPFQVVNGTIQQIIDDFDPITHNIVVTYKEKANVLSIKSRSKGTYYFTTAAPRKVLRLKARKDEKEDYDGDNLDVMNIAVPAGAFDLIDPPGGGTYLSKVITDLGAEDSLDRRQYLLGTITFRRCR
jgi:hypothetical protein